MAEIQLYQLSFTNGVDGCVSGGELWQRTKVVEEEG